MSSSNWSGPLTGTTPVALNTGLFNEFDLSFDEGAVTGTVDVTYKKPGASEATVPASNQITLGTNSGYKITGIEAVSITMTPNLSGGNITYFLTTRRHP